MRRIVPAHRLERRRVRRLARLDSAAPPGGGSASSGITTRGLPTRHGSFVDAPIPVSREEERGKNDQLICCASCVARVPGADCHVEDASRRFAIVEARRLVATAIWTVTTESPQHDGTRYDDRMIRKGRSRRATRRAMASLAGLAVSRWAPQTCRCRLDVAEQPSRGAAD